MIGANERVDLEAKRNQRVNAKHWSASKRSFDGRDFTKKKNKKQERF
jgi:hypothetical protein